MSDSKYSRISKKWVGFVTAIWVQSIAGNNYTFANYSPALKAVMNYNQTQLNNLGVAKDVGKSFGLFAGLLADHLPTWLILLIGALEGAVGYGTQYLVIGEKISPPSYWQVLRFLCSGKRLQSSVHFGWQCLALLPLTVILSRFVFVGLTDCG